MNLNFPLEGDNRAGIKLFYFTPVENIESETSDDVILKSGKTWYTGKAKKYTLSFSERSRRSRSGNVFTNSLTGYIAKRTDAMDAVLNSMIGRDFVVMAEDLNGRKWIIGTIDQPLTFELSSNSGSRPGENSGVEFSFSGKATEITKPVSGIPTTSGEAIEDENGNTLPHHRHKAEDITGSKNSSFISDFTDSVRATILTGLSTATNAVITATDTVLGALGKLQKQITDHKVILDAKEDAANKGIANGYPSLNETGKIPAAQLPSYVDDIVEGTSLSAFPATGEASKVYIALDTNKSYRWSGTTYVEVSPSDVNSVAGKTGIVTLVKGDVGLGNVDNVAQVAHSVDAITGDPNLDLNIKTGVYKVVSATNSPSAPNGTLTVFSNSASRHIQIWQGDSDTLALYARTKGNNGSGSVVWGAWNEVYHTGNDSNLAKKGAANVFTEKNTFKNVAEDVVEIRNSSVSSASASGSTKLGFGFSNHLGCYIGIEKRSANVSDWVFYTENGFNTPVERLRINGSTGQLTINGTAVTLATSVDIAKVADNNILTKTAAFTLANAHKGKTIECDGTFTITIPAGLQAEWNCTIVNIGTGSITVAGATGVTLNGKGTALANQWGGATLYNNAVDSFRIHGDLT